MLRSALLALALVPAGWACRSTPAPAPLPAADARAGFEKLKGLAGDWKGTAGEEEGVLVQYRVTAGGNAIEERLYAGSPHEMLTVYFMDGDVLKLTHYCSAGNQPTMIALAQSSADVLEFECIGVTNVKSQDETHLHQGRVVFAGPDRLEETWTGYTDGRPEGAAQFSLTRAR